MKTFTPTKEMILACETLLKAIAYKETIKPIVEGYQLKILKDMKPKIDIKKFSRLEKKERIITRLFDTYLMSESDFKIYHKRCNDERKKIKLHVDNESFCPLLVAENLERLANYALIESMEGITKLKVDDVTGNLKVYKKLIDLTLKLLVPYVDKEKLLSKI